ncbi:MAG: hypothetical protein GX898_10880, partial [Corynebacterium sp.]|nr:hypothetical protein [Corynebacterium sp.]
MGSSMVFSVFPIVFFLAFLIIGLSIFRSFTSQGMKLRKDLRQEQHEITDARVDAE